MADEQKSNPLNTSYNKTVYVTFGGAAVTLALVTASEFGWHPSAAWVSAVQAFGTAAITLFVRNKEPPN